MDSRTQESIMLTQKDAAKSKSRIGFGESKDKTTIDALEPNAARATHA